MLIAITSARPVVAVNSAIASVGITETNTRSASAVEASGTEGLPDACCFGRPASLSNESAFMPRASCKGAIASVGTKATDVLSSRATISGTGGSTATGFNGIVAAALAARAAIILSSFSHLLYVTGVVRFASVAEKWPEGQPTTEDTLPRASLGALRTATSVGFADT